MREFWLRLVGIANFRLFADWAAALKVRDRKRAKEIIRNAASELGRAA